MIEWESVGESEACTLPMVGIMAESGRPWPRVEEGKGAGTTLRLLNVLERSSVLKVNLGLLFQGIIYSKWIIFIIHTYRKGMKTHSHLHPLIQQIFMHVHSFSKFLLGPLHIWHCSGASSGNMVTQLLLHVTCISIQRQACTQKGTPNGIQVSIWVLDIGLWIPVSLLSCWCCWSGTSGG